jgi:hypothetical protein
MKGKDIKATLSKIQEGEYYDIFNLLPEVAGGPAWTGEIKDCAMHISDLLEDESDYTIDDLRDWGGSFANSECEDYYKNINQRVQELDLWASNDIEQYLEDTGYEGGKSITDLNAQFLCSAMWMLWDAVADQAVQNTEEAEDETD